MRRWFQIGVDEWWIDRGPPTELPPSDGGSTGPSAAYEERPATVTDAERLLRGLFPAPAAVMHRLLEEAGGSASTPATHEERLHQLAAAIAFGRVHAWRRRRPAHGAIGEPEGASSSSSSSRRRPSDPPPPRGTAGAPPPLPNRSPPPPPPPPAPAGALGLIILSWYEFVLLDELDDGIEGVDIEMTTPAGTRWMTTDGSGSVRVDQVPPGQGSASIDLDMLALALQGRADRPRRKTRPPEEADDFKVVTPSRAGRTFSFPDARPHRVMVVSRTDITVAGSDPRWTNLQLAGESKDPCRLVCAELEEVALCSRGQGEPARVNGELPPNPECDPDSAAAAERAGQGGVYVVQPGDSFWAIAEKMLGDGARWEELRDANADLLAGRPPNMIHPGDIVRIPGPPVQGLIPAPGPWPTSQADPPPPFLDLDLDRLHEALFDAKGDEAFDLVGAPLVVLDPPPEPDWGSADASALAASVQAGFVALDQQLPVDQLFEPLVIPDFDPRELEGPPR